MSPVSPHVVRSGVPASRCLSNVMPDAEAMRGYISGILVFSGIFVYQWDSIVQSSGKKIPFPQFWEFLSNCHEHDTSHVPTSPQSCQGKEAREAGFDPHRLSMTSRSPCPSPSHPPRTSLVLTPTPCQHTNPHLRTRTTAFQSHLLSAPIKGLHPSIIKATSHGSRVRPSLGRCDVPRAKGDRR